MKDDNVLYRLELSDSFHSMPAVLYAGNEAAGAWVMCALWSCRNKTPRQIPAAIAERYGTQLAARITEAGLWNAVPDGYEIPRTWYWRFVKVTRREKILAILRERIYERDGHKCVFCGSPDDLTLDHIHPKSLGGADTEDNLQTLCRSCNSSKGARV